MDGPHLSNDEFFTRLSELFDSRRKADHGAVSLEQKRLTLNPPREEDGPLADLHPSSPLPVLIRATNGKIEGKTKLSTVVQPEGLGAFYARYAEVCKSGMQGLRKRDRSGRKKAKAKKRKEVDVEKK